MSARVAIFGSCVSRDLFEDQALRPSLALYAARCSVISAVAPPVAIDPERVVLSSDWQRRCVLADFQKTFFDALAQVRPDWLVIDLVDERFDVLRAQRSYVTRSSAFQAAGLDETAEPGFKRVRRMSPQGEELFATAAPEFVRRVTAVVPAERIVLHRAHWCTHYRDNGSVLAFPEPRLSLCDRQNAMLERGYDALAAALGEGITTIGVDPDVQLADAAHRWELEPFHYEPGYNAAAAGRLTTTFGLR